MEHCMAYIMTNQFTCSEVKLSSTQNSFWLGGMTQSSIVKRYERKAIELTVMVFLLGSIWKVDVLREVPRLSMHRFWRRQHCPVVKRRSAWISCLENSYAIGHLNPQLLAGQSQSACNENATNRHWQPHLLLCTHLSPKTSSDIPAFWA